MIKDTEGARSKARQVANFEKEAIAKLKSGAYLGCDAKNCSDRPCPAIAGRDICL